MSVLAAQSCLELSIFIFQAQREIREHLHLFLVSKSLFQHWNLALTDVDEQFTRRRARKAPVTGGTQPRSGPGDEAGAAREWRVGESVFRILKIKRKVEICVRHVPQVLLRGEHVVMVAPESSNNTDISEENQ